MRPFVLALLLATPAYAEPPSVITDIPPVQSLVAQVMDGIATPGLILIPLSDPHSQALRPSQAAEIEQSDLVFWIGSGLTPWLGAAFENLAADSEVIALADVEGTKKLALSEEDDHGTEADHEDAMDVDPHLWLDPENAALWIDAIAERLADHDPVNADRYRANAATGKAAISAAATDAGAVLTEVADRPFLMAHDSLGYIVDHYGLNFVGAISDSHARRPGPTAIGRLIALVEDENITCLLSEPGSDPGLVGLMQESAELRVHTVDPLASEIRLGPDLYPELIRSLARNVSDCLSGN